MMVAAKTLPPLRQELALFPSPPQRDGSPVWSLHDPAANRFYLITWAAFEMLSRWQLGTPEAISKAVNHATTLSVEDQDVEGLVPFLEAHFLTEPQGASTTGRILAARNKMRSSWWLWLVKNYLFFRVPLVRPQRFLETIAPLANIFFTPLFPLSMLLLAVVGLLLVSRHWDQFIHFFTAFKSLEGIITLAITIPLAKIIHEMGHACAAHRYGCKVPAMGIAFMVMTPMLYTDTNEAWKLQSRRQRLIIGSAGIIAELALAVLATWAWLLLPDGSAKGAAFFLATTAWVMTIALNASPFLRFDGYFILADLLSIPNLHPRSFAFGRWWLREVLFGFGNPEPETVTPGLRRFLIIFSLSVWIYRLVLFLGIALLVYHFFFKALGILLFAVEIIWFIALPITDEIKVWWERRSEIGPTPALFRSLFLLVIGLLLILLPWQSSVSAPAILGAAREQRLVAPAPGRLVDAPATALHSTVKAGDLLARLISPDIDQRKAESAPSASLSRWQVNQQAFNEELLSQGDVLQKRLQGDEGILHSLKGEEDRLQLRAPFDGTVVHKNDEIMLGGWVAAREWVASVADLTRNRVDVYLEEMDLRRISIGGTARFIPDAVEYGAFNCKIAEIDRVSTTMLDDFSLASFYGGPIPTYPDDQHQLVPVSPHYRVRLDQCTPGNVPPIRLRGVAHLEATRQSPALALIRHAWITLIRESGL
jgi:putative peptide zinc metalloprotease protein